MVNRQWAGILVAAAVAVALATGGSAAACGIDGIPSLSANGQLAQRMTAKPSIAILASWAPFAFARPVLAGKTVQLVENMAELKRSLPAQAFGQKWLWDFGDGTKAHDWAIASHTYRHTGLYRIKVSAYYHDYRIWYEFDAAMIHVR